MYGGGESVDAATEMRLSWRLSRVREDESVYPKKSSTGFVEIWTGEDRAGWVTAAEGAATWQSMGVEEKNIVGGRMSFS
jgi:ATP:corrinoid adenosyltransferase